MPSNKQDNRKNVQLRTKMDCLAPEIRAHVCRNTPLSELKALALTSSAWYDSCESHLWKNIDVCTAVQEFTRRSGQARIAFWESIEQRPARAGFIRSLNLGARDVEASTTNAILCAVAPALEELLLPHKGCERTTFGLDTACSVSPTTHPTLTLAGIDFPRLRVLHWSTSLERLAEIMDVLAAMPRLEVLTFCGLGSGRRAKPTYPDRRYMKRAAEALQKFDAATKAQEDAQKSRGAMAAGASSRDSSVAGLTFAHLTFLGISVTDKISAFVAPAIIAGAPSLEKLVLHCRHVDWGFGWDEPVVPRPRESLSARVGQLENLRELYVSCAGDEALREWALALDAEEGHFEALHWLMTGRKWYADPIPSLPKLRTLLIRPKHSDEVEIASVTQDTGDVYFRRVKPRTCTTLPTARYTGRLSDWFVEQFERAPALTELALYNDAQPGVTRLGEDWRELGLFGYIIRVYSGIRGDFYHFRWYRPCERVCESYSLYLWDDSQPIDVDDEEDDRIGWVDSTFYRGQRLPSDVLLAVYEANDDVVAFTTGGRDMEMSAAAWEVLDSWRNSVVE